MNKFSEYLHNYFENYLPEIIKVSNNTISTYKYAFVKLIDFFKDEKKISSDNIQLEMINNSTIEEFITWMIKNNLNSKTINNRITVIKSFLKYVSNRDVEYLNLYNQIKNIPRQKENNKYIKYCNLEEITTIFALLNYKNKKELKDLVIFTLLYECALRVSSLCSLKVEDIDFNLLEINIKNAKGNVNGKVPLTKNTLKIIQLYLNIFSKEEQDYLFTNHKNEKYSRWTINYKLDKLVKKAKIKRPDLFNLKVTPHVIRHSRAMNMLNNIENPVPLSTIQKLLLHKHLSSTQIYAEASPEIVRTAMENNANNINIKRKYNKKKEENLENWLKNNIL